MPLAEVEVIDTHSTRLDYQQLHSMKQTHVIILFNYKYTHRLTFQSSEVTSLLLGTSWPPSLMQCLRTSWVDPPVLFSLRFQIRAVESPDLKYTKKGGGGNIRYHIMALTIFADMRGWGFRAFC